MNLEGPRGKGEGSDTYCVTKSPVLHIISPLGRHYCTLFIGIPVAKA